MSNMPSPMHRPQASRAYDQLMRREISADQYLETLKREAQSDVQRILDRRRQRDAKAA